VRSEATRNPDACSVFLRDPINTWIPPLHQRRAKACPSLPVAPTMPTISNSFSINTTSTLLDKTIPDCATLTATSENGRWQATLYGRNLTNEFYYSFNTEVAGFIGRQLSTVSRDFQRYGGITVTYRF
jgi:hypothetical protein